MGTLMPPLAAETEALRQAYAALNRDDVSSFVNAFDPQIEWTEPPRVSRSRDISRLRGSGGARVAGAR